MDSYKINLNVLKDMCWSCHLVIIDGRLQSKVHWNYESVKRVGDPIELGHTQGEILKKTCKRVY
jgi:hypothetical protein